MTPTDAYSALERDAEKLRPCPHCGGKAVHKLVQTYSLDSSYYVIACTKCPAAMDAEEKLTALDVADWNRRTGDNRSLIARAETAEALVKELEAGLREARENLDLAGELIEHMFETGAAHTDCGPDAPPTRGYYVGVAVLPSIVAARDRARSLLPSEPNDLGEKTAP